MQPTILEIEDLVRQLNNEAFAGELEHHGSATTRYDFRGNGEDIVINFMGHPIWCSSEDEREFLGGEDPIAEPLEAFLRRESAAFMTRIMATPTPDAK